jgi:hypothetical protein
VGRTAEAIEGIASERDLRVDDAGVSFRSVHRRGERHHHHRAVPTTSEGAWAITARVKELDR